MNRQKNNIISVLYNPTPLRILSFFSLNPCENFSAKEIAVNTSASKVAVHQALRLLIDLEIVQRSQKGNVFLYAVNEMSLLPKSFKMFETLLKLQPLIKQIKQYAYQIILFGSSASGENIKDSDVDLFIKTSDKEAVQKIVNKLNRGMVRLNAVIYDPLELVEAQKQDKAFLDQIKKGIVVFEGEPQL